MTSRHHHHHHHHHRRLLPSSLTAMPLKSCLKKEGSYTPPKKVWFDELKVIEFPMILCDYHPFTSAGVPVTISWKPQRKATIEVEYYEIFRAKRRNLQQMQLSPQRREQIARKGGASETQIDQAAHLINASRQAQSHIAQHASATGDGKITDWLILREKLVVTPNPKYASTRSTKLLTPYITTATPSRLSSSRLSSSLVQQSQKFCTNAAA